MFFLLLCNVCYAQQTERVFVRKYTQKDGIGSYNIRRITEDKFGFMWVASQDGLSRFDGKNFVSYTTSAAPDHRLYGMDVREIIADTKEDLLWVLPAETGVNVINTITGRVVKNIPIPALGIEDWNTCMLKDSNSLWIGTFTGLRFFDIKRNKFENLPLLKGNTTNPVEFEVRSVLKDRNGNIWVCYSGFGIVVYNGNTRKIITHIGLSSLNDHQKSNKIKVFKSVELDNRTIVLATNQGLRKITYNNRYSVQIDNQPCKAYLKLNTESIAYIAIDKDGVLVSGYDGLFRLDTAMKRYSVLEEVSKTAKSDWLVTVQSIYIDSKNNTWLACQEGIGFIYNQKSPFEPYMYDQTGNIKLDHVRTVYPLQDGNILAGLQNGMVYLNNSSRIYTSYDQGHLYHHVFQDKNNKIIVSRPDGMFIFSDGILTPIAKVYSEFSSFSAMAINSHIFYDDSTIILGTESNNGILIWNFVQKKVRQIKKGTGAGTLSSNIVNNIYKDSKNNLWVLSDNVINILSDRFTKSKELIPKETPTATAYKLFFDVCEAGGYYWLASYGSGVLQLDSSFQVKKAINIENGLSNDGVYQLYNIQDKFVLATSNNGVSLLNLATFKCRNYYSSDGLHSNGFEEVSGLENNGKIYAGGLNGFTIVDPSKFSINTNPPVFYFTGIKTELKDQSLDTSNLYMQTITIPNNWLRTNISFTGINYSKPEAVFYKYRIKEQDTSWIDIGPQNFISLIGLPPGSYNVEVKASNEDGYWSKPVNLLLVFKPKWYETVLFEICVILAISLILYALYRYRVQQILKLERVRQKISSDLHDDIGSTLSSVNLFTKMAIMQPGKKEYLPYIDQGIQNAIIGVRDIIWILDKHPETIESIFGRIVSFSGPLCEAAGSELETRIDDGLKQYQLTAEEKRNTYLVIKEAINNSLKYSGCTRIQLTATENAGQVSISVNDNGKGLAKDEAGTTKIAATGSGNGLKNMQLRCDEIKWKLEIKSAADAGTTVTMIGKLRT